MYRDIEQRCLDERDYNESSVNEVRESVASLERSTKEASERLNTNTARLEEGCRKYLGQLETDSCREQLHALRLERELQLATMIAAVSEEQDAQTDAKIAVLQSEVAALQGDVDLYAAAVAKRHEIAAKLAEYQASHAEECTSE